MKSYGDMLKEAEEKLPKNVEKKERLEIPRLEVLIQGNQTFITNFDEVVTIMRREPKHFAKFLFRELAKPGHIDGKRLILQGKVFPRLVDKKLQSYIKEFLYCKECDITFDHDGIKKEYSDPVFGPCAKYVATCPQCNKEVDEFRRPKPTKSYKPQNVAPCGNPNGCCMC